MRMMLMHRHDQHTEAGEPVPLELVEKMGAFIGEFVQRGQFLDGNGLGASKTRTRLRFRDGACTVQHGPYTGAHELPHACALLTVRTRDEAIAWAERWGKILGDGEIELGPVNEPWDLGVMPRPDDAPLRVLLIEKSSPASEAGRARTPAQKTALARLTAEMKQAGVLVSSFTLQPSSRAKRMFFTSNKLRVVDGPFAESKELVGGYALFELPSIDAAIELSKRYAELLGGTLEADIRPLAEDE